ncbi:Fic family protein [Mycoavidus sp. B2-EB]|uniref:Fic family protein n=1 Tax=Mycoavidus sp. B2-EB TaxID=2651972 RepID=UPI001628A573|nr:Fic family protein [Mycoavidus sp. B2-EB]BBO58935.1 Fic family protein [Mycoavidus sp. B2-EB]
MHKSDIDTAEVLFTGGKSEAQARKLVRAAASGEVRRIYAGVFTANCNSPLEAVVLRNWAAIVGYLLPNAVLAFRSALEHRPVEGVLHVSRIGQRRRTLELPGLTVHVYPGASPISALPPVDNPYRGLFLPSEERGILENLSTRRGSKHLVLSQQALEERLEKILTIRGEFKLNELRDRAKAVADQLGMYKEMSRLESIIGAMLGTHKQKKLKSQLALARAAGMPYDPDRIDLFEALHAQLNTAVFAPIPDPAPLGIAMENFAFFEAYFSNYIEGTTFEVEEAEKIVFEGTIILNRSEDSHDILGTFHAATSPPWRNQSPQTEDDFLSWLKNVNALVMQARPDKEPGRWKAQANQAGNTLFVLPELVRGTLREGFVRIKALTDPVARALMTMFVITEVHPFRDGNGRTARLAMNCMLCEAKLCRIMIPTVYREDYLLPLKRLTNEKDAQPFIRTMTRIHNWTAQFNYAQDRQLVREQLARCNAFHENLRDYRLIFPSDMP